MGLVQVPVGVRGADDPVPPPGNDKEHGLLGPQDQPDSGLETVPRNHQVDSLGRAHLQLAALGDHGLGFVGPDPGGVDDLLGPDVEVGAVLAVHHLGAHHTFAFAQEVDDGGLVDRVRTVVGGGPHQVGHVLGVVHLAVVVADGPDEGVILQARGGAQRAPARQVLVERHAALVPAGNGHGVVQRDAGADVRPLDEVFGQRIQEGHRPGQVRAPARKAAARVPAAPPSRGRSRAFPGNGGRRG
jgi:hypothetical protein